MSVIVWAGILKVVYGASISDASEFGQQIQITCKEVAQKSWYCNRICCIKGAMFSSSLEINPN
jgi:tRNA(Arg) A34 adenosine deaminase TadA